MTALPSLYARFRPLFAKMDLPLRKALEGMLANFATLPLPTTADERQTSGAFVGYDGIENRGRLSNLLESEWLLRELDPDDFVRRVAESEVMFRRRDFEGTGVKDVLCVVLDCGPWMLGNHRIIALASLFYLAIRADRISARLLWTVPGVTKGWSEDLTQANIRTFLGRIVQDPLPVSALDAALEDLETGPRECWYVGSAQTENLTRHPDVTGSIIARKRYDAHEVDVKITSRGRTSTLQIAPAQDADTVAALRRPFAPERKKTTRLARDIGDLTVQPFHRDWLLDRFNQAVLIRYPNGALWYPFLRKARPTWLAIPSDKTLLGLQPQSSGRLCVLLATGETETELVTVDVSQNPAKVSARETGYFDTKIGPQPTYAMGNLHVVSDAECLLVAADGTNHAVRRDGFSDRSDTENRVVMSDGVYLIELTKGTLRVKNPRRGTLAKVPLPVNHQELCQKPRRTVFSPDTKAVTFTTDGVQHTALVGLDIVPFALEGMALLHLHSTEKALAWDAAENRLVPFQLINGRVRASKGTVIKTPVTGMPRYCPLTQTVFAINTDAGGDSYTQFVPLHTTRGWQCAEAFDILDAVEGAETLWL